jgi:type I restriction enzyme S subunit
MRQYRIPNAWKEVKLGDITDYGKTQKCELSDVPSDTWVLELEDIEKDSSRILKHLDSTERPFKSTKNKFSVGDVLYGKLRPYLNKVVIANNSGVCSTEIIPLNVEPHIDNRFLFYWLKSKTFLDFVNSVSYGVNMPRLGTKDGLRAPFILAPLAEQKVIADKLDTLLAQVETTKARLERIPEILKTLRQSVLAAAVSGKLNAGDYQQAPVYKALGDVGVEVKTGPFGSALHKSEYISGGIPVINPMHISNGTIVASQQMTIPKAKYDELEAWHLKIGDVVVGRRGEMGRAAVVNYKGEMLCGTGSMILRTPKNSLPKYLEIILRSPLAVEYFTSNSVGSTMVNLNQKIIKSLQVHFPSQEEQTEIVRRVEKLFAYADKVEAQVKTAQARVNQLTQSILAKAFRGELTANWRAANPELISGENSAEALLVIIKNERAKLSQTKKGRGKSVEN